ncbi:MAG: cytochrome c [Candidatus Brocadiae bacterium]|nr:cytochrome c [Candidatus Brocadiia bacterium]
MVEPIPPDPTPPVSRVTVAAVALFVTALVLIVVFFVPAAEPKLPPGVVDPAVIFAERCALCHGPRGEGRGKFPKIAGTPLSAEEITRILEAGKGEMPKLDASPEQRAAVAGWVKDLE